MLSTRRPRGRVLMVAAALMMAGPIAAFAQTPDPPTAAPQAPSVQGAAQAPQPAPAAQPQAKPAAGQANPPAEQAKPADAAEDKREPDEKAFRDASAMTDTDKQIEALRKMIEDFPQSTFVPNAESLIVTALTRKASSDVKALQEEAKKYSAGGATPNEQARRLGQLASGLSGAGVLLDEAEEYAKKALELLKDEAAWVTAEKKAAAEAADRAAKKEPAAKPRPAVSDADYASRFVTQRQGGLVTLAQIYEKRGKAGEAEKTYREAFSLQPQTGGAAALKLAEFAKAAGHPFEQLEYLTVATLAGRVTAASRAELEALYTQTHGGSPADLDRMLDERHAKTLTKVHAPAYVRPKGPTGRVVLAELFTGAGCPPCVGADLAFDGALERYAARDFALLVYHLHIPRPDPLTNPSTEARKGFYDVPGTPTFFVDGGDRHVGGGNAAGAQKLFDETIRPAVEKRLDARPGAAIRVEAAMKGDTVSVQAKVSKTGKPGRKLRAQVALVEEHVHYTGENGVRFHSMVVRSLASAEKDTLGFAVASGKGLTLRHTFDLGAVEADAKSHLDAMEGGSSKRFGTFQFVERKSDLDRSRLRVVVFVQDEETKEVLQAAFQPIRAARAAAGAGSAGHRP